MGVYERKARILRPTIEPGRRVLVISDIHANLPYFHGVLDKVGFSDEDLLILNGDFLEKGKESLKTLHEVMAMCKTGPRPFRRFRKLPGGQALGHLPRCLRRMAHFRGILREGQLALADQPQDPRLLR